MFPCCRWPCADWVRLKTHQQHWFRSGTIEMHMGEAICFGPEETEAAITARLHDEVERLMEGGK